jgi:hypothetical protein
LFLNKQNSSKNLLSRLPFVLKNFFKFSSRFFGGISSNYLDFIHNHSSANTIYKPKTRVIDSSFMSFYILKKNSYNLAKLFLKRKIKSKNARFLSFLSRLTTKEIYYFIRNLRQFKDTSRKFNNQTKPYKAR